MFVICSLSVLSKSIALLPAQLVPNPSLLLLVAIEQRMHPCMESLWLPDVRCGPGLPSYLLSDINSAYKHCRTAPLASLPSAPHP